MQTGSRSTVCSITTCQANRMPVILSYVASDTLHSSFAAYTPSSFLKITPLQGPARAESQERTRAARRHAIHLRIVRKLLEDEVHGQHGEQTGVDTHSDSRQAAYVLFPSLHLSCTHIPTSHHFLVLLLRKLAVHPGCPPPSPPRRKHHHPALNPYPLPSPLHIRLHKPKPDGTKSNQTKPRPNPIPRPIYRDQNSSCTHTLPVTANPTHHSIPRNEQRSPDPATPCARPHKLNASLSLF